MTRPLRLEYPGALWHVTNRGVGQRRIYLDDDDRLHFLALLAHAAEEQGWPVVAYVLMSNHYHRLCQTPQPNLSHGMRALDGAYGACFNTRHGRVGHLFQGRFKSHLIDSEAYLLDVARYIVLNPVRAGMVATSAEWKWSSYRATAGLEPVPSWLDPSPLLDRFDPLDWNRATSGYREYVAAADGSASPWKHLVAQAFLGRPEFLREVEERARAAKHSREHPRDQRLYRAVTLDDVRQAFGGEWPPPPRSVDRMLFVLVATRDTNATRAEIGRCLGISGQAVGRILHIAETRIQDDPMFVLLVEKATARIQFRLST